MRKKICYKFRDYLNIYQKEFINNKKKKDKFIQIIIKNGTAIIIQNKKGEILIINEFRMGLKKRTWGLPGGQIEKKTTIKKTIIREVFEETNLEIKYPKLFLKYTLHGNYFVCKEYIFFCKKFFGKVQTEKNTRHQWVNLKKLKKMLFTNKFETAGVVAVIIKYIYLREKRLIKV